MEFKRRLMRLAIDSAVERTIPKLKKDHNRGIRSLVDLGAQFASGERQKAFFCKLQEIARNPKNPYSALLIRAVNETDTGIVKRAGVNLGYTALTCGSGLLQNYSAKWAVPLPWMIQLDCPGCSAGQLSGVLREGGSYGILSYIFSVRSREQFTVLAKLAKEFEEYLFWAVIPPFLADMQTAHTVRELKNIVVIAEVSDTAAFPFEPLKAQQLLYGFLCRDRKPFNDRAFLSAMTASGCLFGVYTGASPLNAAGKRERRFFYTSGKRRLPLALIDLQRDVPEIGGQIVPGSGYQVIHEDAVLRHQFDLEAILRESSR